MIRHLQFAIRQGLAPWVALPALVLFCLNAYQRGLLWRGDAFLTVDAQSIPLFIIGPILVAAVATDTARASRPGAQHHVAFTRPVMRPYLFVVWSGWLPTLAVVGLADLLSFTYSATYYFDASAILPALLQVGVHAAALLFLVAVGSVLGRFLPPTLAGLFGAAAGLALIYSDVSRTARHFSTMALGGATVPRIGLHYNWRYQLVQFALLAVLAVVIYFAAPRFAESRTGVSMAIGLALVLVVAAVTVRVDALPAQRWVAVSGPTMTCTGNGPQLCLTPQHEHARSTIAADVDALSTAAATAGLTDVLPGHIIEMTRSNRADVDGVNTWGVTLEDAQLRGQKADLQMFIINALVPKACDDITPAMDQAITRLASSLIVSAGVTARDVVIGSEEDHVVLGPDQARAARDTLARCGR